MTNTINCYRQGPPQPLAGRPADAIDLETSGGTGGGAGAVGSGCTPASGGAAVGGGAATAIGAAAGSPAGGP
jgi:hypothetical protein